MEIACVGDFIASISELRGTRDYDPTTMLGAGAAFERWYRGERDASWNIQPKIFRIAYDERDLTNRFRVLAKSRHPNTPEYNNYGLFLSLMQHYELPTRLLDWSTSPLIALYFAIQDHIYERQTPEIDASVWILDPYRLNRIQTGNASTPSIEGDSVRKFLRPAFTDYVPAPPPGPDHLLRFPDGADEDRVCAVMGAETDVRIFSQQGCFTIHTTGKPLQQSHRSNEYLSRIIIPGRHVKNIAKELVLCGFRKSTIFPDLVNLSRDLRALYE